MQFRSVLHAANVLYLTEHVSAHVPFVVKHIVVCAHSFSVICSHGFEQSPVLSFHMQLVSAVHCAELLP